MKSMFDRTVRAEVMNRIDALSAHSRPLWGEMTVAQMARHCAICEEYYHGNIKVNRSLLGRIVGRMAMNGILKDEDSSLRRNAPTSPIFKVIENISDFEAERGQWKSLIERYGTFDKDEFIHWFFGRMTRDQLGQFIYKHSDHHLRQFGV